MRKLFVVAVALMLATIASRGQAAVNYQLEIDKYRDLSATPPCQSVTVFTDGDALTEVFEFSGATRRSGGMGVVRELLVIAAQSTTVGFDLVLSSRTFTGSPLNEAFTPVKGEMNNSLETTITVTASDWVSLGGVSYARITGIDYVYDLPDGQDDLHAQAVMNVGDESVTANNLVFKLKVAWLD